MSEMTGVLRCVPLLYSCPSITPKVSLFHYFPFSTQNLTGCKRRGCPHLSLCFLLTAQAPTKGLKCLSAQYICDTRVVPYCSGRSRQRNSCCLWDWHEWAGGPALRFQHRQLSDDGPSSPGNCLPFSSGLSYLESSATEHRPVHADQKGNM